MNRKDIKFSNYAIALSMIDILLANGEINQATHANIMRHTKRNDATRRY